MSPIPVAIIGCGSIARIGHAPAFQWAERNGLCRLVGVCDLDAALAQSLADACGVPAFTSTETLLEKARPEVVSISTPPFAHRDLSLMALEAGCHVLCDKPVAMNLDEAKDMVRAAARADRLLSICFSTETGTSLPSYVSASSTGISAISTRCAPGAARRTDSGRCLGVTRWPLRLAGSSPTGPFTTSIWCCGCSVTRNHSPQPPSLTSACGTIHAARPLIWRHRSRCGRAGHRGLRDQSGAPRRGYRAHRRIGPIAAAITAPRGLGDSRLSRGGLAVSVSALAGSRWRVDRPDPFPGHPGPLRLRHAPTHGALFTCGARRWLGPGCRGRDSTAPGTVDAIYRSAREGREVGVEPGRLV